MDIPTKVALVTGAARGIGLTIAQKFIAENYRVALLDIDAETLAQTAEAGAGLRVRCRSRLADGKGIRQLLRQQSRIVP